MNILCFQTQRPFIIEKSFVCRIKILSWIGLFINKVKLWMQAKIKQLANMEIFAS